jgi:hypothetical protein
MSLDDFAVSCVLNKVAFSCESMRASMPILESLTRSYRSNRLASARGEEEVEIDTYHEPVYPVLRTVKGTPWNKMPILINLVLSLKPVSGVGDQICRCLRNDCLSRASSEAVQLLDRPRHRERRTAVTHPVIHSLRLSLAVTYSD